jgi:hypothetical protein
MNEPTREPASEPQATPPGWNLEAAEAAYGVIARYVDHAQVSGVIIALLAGALGEEKVKFIVQTEHWQKYMASRRELEAARADIDRLTGLIEAERAQAGGAGAAGEEQA